MSLEDREKEGAYGAEDGTIFDTRYRHYDDVYVAEDNTVIAKPQPEFDGGDDEETSD